MAHQTLNVWIELQKFDVNFDAVESGSSQFKADVAAAAVARRSGIEVQQDVFPAPHDLFLEGRIGGKESGPPEHLLRAIAGRLASEEIGIMPQAANLQVQYTAESLLGTHIQAAQMIQGLPIYGSAIQLHIDHEGQPYAVTGRPFPEALGATLRDSASRHPDPIAIASDYLGLPFERHQVQVEQVALPVEGEFIACWKVRAATRQPFGVWTALVSFDGVPFAVYNIASAAYGEAHVFLQNPYRGAISRSRLDHLNAPMPATLHGSYAVIRSHAGVASSPNGAFLYPPDDVRFDEPCLYFFLDQTRKAFELLGRAPFSGQHVLAPANFNPMHGIVHDPQALDNAFYNPQDGYLYFGDITDAGTVVRSTSRSRDIVIHEFSHAVTDAICRLGRTRHHTESRAMSEGFSDYFACSFLDHPIMGDYFVDDAAGFRTCENSQSFPPGYAGEEHAVGEIWASFLWSLRQDPEIGPMITDALALESLYFLGPSRTILQGFHALLQADRGLFPKDALATQGRHEERIKALFTTRQP